MACFSGAALLSILIWIVIICAIVAIIKVVVPYITAQLGGAGSVVVRIVSIVLWAALAIVVLIFAFEMISCLASMGPSLRIGR